MEKALTVAFAALGSILMDIVICYGASWLVIEAASVPIALSVPQLAVIFFAFVLIIRTSQN